MPRYATSHSAPKHGSSADELAKLTKLTRRDGFPNMGDIRWEKHPIFALHVQMSTPIRITSLKAAEIMGAVTGGAEGAAAPSRIFLRGLCPLKI